MASFKFLATPVWTQPGDPATLLQDAEADRADGFHTEAMAKLEQVSRDFPGTDYDLYSRLNRAQMQFGAHNKTAAKELFSSIVQNFPGRSEATIARINLADIRYIDENGSFQNYLTELDSIAVSMGGPSVSRVVQGGGSLTVNSLPGIAAQAQQESLAEIYHIAASRFTAKKDGVTPDDLNKSLALLLFDAEQFPGILQENFQEVLADTIRSRDGDFDYTKDNKAPKIHLLKVRKRPGAFEVFVSVTDNLWISPASVDLFLDGQKIETKKILRYRPMHKKVEKFKLDSLKIVIKEDLSNLSPGRHEITCRAEDGVGNVASKSRTLRVQGDDCAMEQTDVEDSSDDEF